MQNEHKKQIIKNALAETVIELRGKKSQFKLASENDISIAIISTIERGLKDPQLTTVFKLAEAFDMDIIKFLTILKAKLPKDFSLIDK